METWKKYKEALDKTSFWRIYTMLLSEPLNPLSHRIISDLRAFFLFHRSFRFLYREYSYVQTRDTNKKRLIYVGESESLNYLSKFYFPGSTLEYSSTVSLLDLKKKIENLIAKDRFIFVEVNRLINFIIPKGFSLTFPWIRQKVPLKDDSYLGRKRKINSTFRRTVRKYGYHSRMTREPEAVSKFYNEFYVPYITGRFHELCFLRSLEEFQHSVQSGFLLQVFDGKKWVSGAICQVSGKSVTVLAFGVHSHHFDLLKQGVLSSAYCFIFDWAEKTGMETVDLLRSRANARDGVFEHKRRWGALPEKDPWIHTAIGIFTPDSAMIPPLLEDQLIWHEGRFVKLRALRKE